MFEQNSQLVEFYSALTTFAHQVLRSHRLIVVVCSSIQIELFYYYPVKIDLLHPVNFLSIYSPVKYRYITSKLNC